MKRSVNLQEKNVSESYKNQKSNMLLTLKNLKTILVNKSSGDICQNDCVIF